MIPPTMYGVKSMNVARLLVQETGTYNEMYRRPFETGMDYHTKNAIMNAVDRAATITPAGLAGVAQSFIRPAAAPESAIHVVNGWNEPRMRFMLEIVTEDRTGHSRVREYVIGATDHPGYSHGGALDPNMIFYVNGTWQVQETMVSNHLGNQMSHRQVDASQVLVNDQYAGIMGNNKMYGLRPEDLYDHIDSMDISDADSLIMDGRAQITRSGAKNRRTNSIAPVYMANVMDSYLQSSRNARMEGQSRIVENARATVESRAMNEDPFMTMIRATSPNGGASFTLNDLVKIDPNVVNVIQFEPLNSQMRASLHYAGQTNAWGGADVSTQWAATLAQALPGYMTLYGITKLHLRSTNHTAGSIPVTTVVNVRTLQQGLDISRDVQALVFRFEHEMIKALTYNGMLSYNLDLSVDIMGDTVVNVSVNGQPVTPYVMPTFLDALMAPVTTFSKERLDTVTSDFDNLLSEIVEADAMLSQNAPMTTGRI